MSSNATPPRWAEALLRAVLKPTDFESVSGDLLEHYRETVYPNRGEQGADRWYAMQVFGFVLADTWIFAVIFSAQFLARMSLDWFMPAPDYHTRAAVSTLFGVGTLLAAGFWASWRSDSIKLAAIAGTLTAGLAAVISLTGAAALLLTAHDSHAMAAIRGSGGLEEVFSLPVMMVLPGVLLGSLGGAASIAIKKLLPA